MSDGIAATGVQDGIVIGGHAAELRLVAHGSAMVRVSLLQVDGAGRTPPPPSSPELALDDAGQMLASLRVKGTQEIRWAGGTIRVSAEPLSVAVADAEGRPCVALRFAADGSLGFALGDAPVFGLGQGGRQFDRRGGTFPLVNGQGEGVRAVDMNQPGARAPRYDFDLPGEGARITIPWIIGADGWAMFLHRPFGTFDLTGPEGRFTPTTGAVLPFDIFVVLSCDPPAIMAQYAALTGHPHLPPLWSLGYLQSHRTLASRDEILAEAKEFRARRLPCDGMIYLGTGFCRDGWNTGHGSFAFNPRVFPDPAAMLRQLHDDGMRVMVHVVDPPQHLHGTVADASGDPDSVAQYWTQHAPADHAGIDGWWPDVGDMLDPAARLARIRMYWDGPVRDHPDRRPFALHRNAYAGVQRYGWIWSGDIDSAWRTLAMQVPVGLNVGLTGIPYWGTDTGGFITRRELTGELFVRWFQFSAFCPSFRSHGRTWKLRLPWGWNTGEYGPEEHDGRRTELPDPSELRNPAVEPICRQYLELRYRLLPYLYSAVREAAETGLPLMRALWLHYPDDKEAVRRGDLYLWGRDILVAPVVEKGATHRELYLPAGRWHDFWSGAMLEGGRSIRRAVDLATLPLFVRAGAIVPTGPVKQHTGQTSDEPVLLTVYPGADGHATLYEDDGASFAYRHGAWRKILLTWHDATGQLEIALAPGSRPLEAPRRFAVRRAGATTSTRLFDGTPLAVTP